MSVQREDVPRFNHAEHQAFLSKRPGILVSDLSLAEGPSSPVVGIDAGPVSLVGERVPWWKSISEDATDP